MKKSLITLLTLAMIGLGLMGCRSTAPKGNLDAFSSQLDDQLPGWLARYRVPGTAVALIRDGEIVWTEGYGVANREQNTPVTENTVFQVASISKSFTAWGVLHLVETGQIELDAPVEQYLTRWHLPPSAYDTDSVTVRRLLSHTAGISIMGYGGQSPEEPLPSLEESLLGNNSGEDAVYIKVEPGSEFRYSGGGYTILQLLIEEVTGKSYSEYMQQEVLIPLGMSQSSFEWRDDLRPLTATGYDENGQPHPNFLFTEKAAAGLYSTVTDMARFVNGNMLTPQGETPGRGIISADALNLMYTPAAQLITIEALFSGESYGFGHFIETLPDGSKLVGHTGSNYGWMSIFLYIPEKNEGIVVLTNSDNGLLLLAQVVRAWGKWLGSGAPMLGRTLNNIYLFFVVLAGVLGLGLLFVLARFVNQSRQGYRQWVWRLSTGSKLRVYLVSGLYLLLSAAIIWAWWTIIYPLSLNFLVFDVRAIVTWIVTAWGVYGIITAFRRRVKA